MPRQISIPASLPAFKEIPHFLLGQKKVYFPNYTVTLIRTPKLPPTKARFRVPLHMNKLDLRDYLFHGYGVRAFNITSSILQRPVELYKDADTVMMVRPPLEYHRRRAVKFMTVEMDQPFMWPEMFSEEELNKHWNKKAYADTEKSYEEQELNNDPRVPWKEGTDGIPQLKQERETLAEQAKQLLSGKAKWEPTWKTIGRDYS